MDRAKQILLAVIGGGSWLAAATILLTMLVGFTGRGPFSVKSEPAPPVVLDLKRPEPITIDTRERSPTEPAGEASSTSRVREDESGTPPSGGDQPPQTSPDDPPPVDPPGQPDPPTPDPPTPPLPEPKLPLPKLPPPIDDLPLPDEVKVPELGRCPIGEVKCVIESTESVLP